MPVSKVQHHRFATLLQVTNSRPMRINQIGNMNVISNPGTIPCGIVIPGYKELLALSQNSLIGQFQQMGRIWS